MTSSSEARVIRRVDALDAPLLTTPDLRTGTWTRLGGSSLFGDAVTESTLGGIADRARARAEADGYAAGWAAGQRDAEEQAAADRADVLTRTADAEDRRTTEHRQAVAALREAAARLRAQTDLVREQLEAQGLELALAVTEGVLGATAAQSVPADVVRRVLEVLRSDSPAVVRVHPSVAREVSAADLGEHVSLEADPSLAPADALVQLTDHVLDLRVDQALHRVREALA